MTLQFLVAMIAAAINDRLQRKLDYVEEERRILKEQLEALSGGKRLSFTAQQRRRLAEAGKLLTPDERQKCCQLVKAATILAWFRQLAAKKYDSSKARRGRPCCERRHFSLHVRNCATLGITKEIDLRAGLLAARDSARTTSRGWWPGALPAHWSSPAPVPRALSRRSQRTSRQASARQTLDAASSCCARSRRIPPTREHVPPCPGCSRTTTGASAIARTLPPSSSRRLPRPGPRCAPDMPSAGLSPPG